ncbi:MAG: DUF2726 domain-containing protein [Firmicutes bacterium]|nr:DUF2726 domain-containing protein [Bacillota bacterium]
MEGRFKMSSILISLLILVILVLILYYTGILEKLLKRPEVKEVQLPYKKRTYLLTKAERSFYEVLNSIAKKQNLKVFTKVRIADLLYLPKKVNNRTSYQNRINSKHIDFVICDTVHIMPLIAVELDDSSHQQAKRVHRDEFVNKAFKDAGLPLLRIPVKQSYSVIELTGEIDRILSPAQNEVAAAPEHVKTRT